MKLRLRYLSDLHLEFIKPSKMTELIEQIPSGFYDICILAGDIGNPYQENYDIFMNFISENFKKSFVIAGNHEYYNRTKTIGETNEYLTNYFKKFNNITFLNNSYEYYENQCFIGTTLWSKIMQPQYEINDIYCIPNFDYIKYNRLNSINIDFLEDALEKNENCIVITHHMPSYDLLHPKYVTPRLAPYNQWFCSNLNDLLVRKMDKIDCWIYGHTHTPSYRKLCGVPFACNPIGYPGENPNPCFNTAIELDIKI
jgi:predicted phosphodiesterase